MSLVFTDIVRPGSARIAAFSGKFHDTIIRDRQGSGYKLRPIRPSDAPALIRAYDALSDEDKWFRMLHNVPHLSEATALRFCTTDPERDICFVIEGRGPLNGEILGGARIAMEGDGVAEFSVSLRPEAQNRGLGVAALRKVLLAARARGVTRVWGLIANQNTAMQSLAKRIGFVLRPALEDPTLVQAELDLRAAKIS